MPHGVTETCIRHVRCWSRDVKTSPRDVKTTRGSQTSSRDVKNVEAARRHVISSDARESSGFFATAPSLSPSSSSSSANAARYVRRARCLHAIHPPSVRHPPPPHGRPPRIARSHRVVRHHRPDSHRAAWHHHRPPDVVASHRPPDAVASTARGFSRVGLYGDVRRAAVVCLLPSFGSLRRLAGGSDLASERLRRVHACARARRRRRERRQLRRARRRRRRRGRWSARRRHALGARGGSGGVRVDRSRAVAAAPEAAWPRGERRRWWRRR